MAPAWVEPAKLLVEVAKVAAAVGAGAWAYHRFVRERTHAPQVEFDVACCFLGPQAGAYIAECTLTFRNKGLIRQEIRRIRLRTRGIRRGEALAYWPSREPRLAFPDKIFVEQNIIPERYEYIFIEPGITQSYKYVSFVPDKVAFIIVNAEFFYKDGNEHSAERVFEVQATTAAAT